MKYARELAAWLADNPNASQEQIEQFLANLAQEAREAKKREAETLRALRESTIATAEHVRQTINDIYRESGLPAGTMVSFRVTITETGVVTTAHRVKTPGVQTSVDIDMDGSVTQERVRNARPYRKRD